MPKFFIQLILMLNVSSFAMANCLCDNICIYGSWLYWKVNCDELEFAVVKDSVITRSGIGSQDVAGPTGQLFTGPFVGAAGSGGDPGPPATKVEDKETFYDVKGNWDPGFRIGFAVNVPDSSWDADLNWTHFDSSSSKSKHVFGSESADVVVGLPSLFDYYSGILSSTDSAEIHGKLNFRYNTVDLEFGRWLCLCNDCVVFRPHIGFRYADIEDRFSNSWELFGTSQTIIAAGTNAKFHAKNTFHGLGVRVGFDADLRLCDGFSLIGRSAFSLISGRTHLKQTFNHDAVVASATVIAHEEIKEHYRQKRAIADLSFGIHYEDTLCNCYPAFIELAWEHHYLWGMHRFWVDNAFEGNSDENPETTSGSKKTGDVAVQGLTLTLGICF